MVDAFNVSDLSFFFSTDVAWINLMDSFHLPERKSILASIKPVPYLIDLSQPIGRAT